MMPFVSEHRHERAETSVLSRRRCARLSRRCHQGMIPVAGPVTPRKVRTGRCSMTVAAIVTLMRRLRTPDSAHAGMVLQQETLPVMRPREVASAAGVLWLKIYLETTGVADRS